MDMKKYRILLSIILVLGLAAGATAVPVSAFTTDHTPVEEFVGVTVCDYHEGSDLLIIGDSRTVQMYNAGKIASYVSKWGGHYGYGGEEGQIDTDERIKEMKQMIDRIVETCGHAYIFLLPTINDYSEGGDYSGALACYMDLYDELKGYNEKAVIYCPELIQKRYTSDEVMAPFNNALKDRVENFVDVDTSKLEYLSDGVHFSDADIEYLFRVFRESIGVDMWGLIHDSVLHMLNQARRRLEDL